MILRTLTVGVPTTRLFLTVGVLGGYTTFSTFGYETIALLRESSFGSAVLNVLGQVALGLQDLPATVEKATVLFYRAGERPPKG